MKRFLALAFVAVTSIPLFAASRTWTGTNSGLWSDPGNWGGTAPVSGDTLVFPSGVVPNKSTSNDLVGFATTSITFTGSGYTLDGNAISLGGGTINLGNGNETFKLPIAVTALETISSSGNGFTSFSGVISGSGPVNITGPEEILFTGANTATGQLSFSGGDTLTISGATAGWPGPVVLNTFNTVVNGGATVGPLTVSAGAEYQPIAAHSGNFIMQAGSTFLMSINTNPFHNVTGTVDLGGATLKIVTPPGVFVPAGTLYAFITNDGSDSVMNTFAGLPQGATVLSDSGQPFTISYTGGTGNDVVLTSMAMPTSTALGASANPITGAVIFTATVTPNGTSPPPSGTVTFKEGANTIGTGSVNSSGVASFTASSLAPGSHSVVAVYGGDSTFAGSTSAPVVEVVGSTAVPALDGRALILLGVLFAVAGAIALRR